MNRSPGLAVKSFGERLSRLRHLTLRPGQRKWLKRQSSKKVRRIAKLDPEFAPKRMTYRGWAD